MTSSCSGVVGIIAAIVRVEGTVVEDVVTVSAAESGIRPVLAGGVGDVPPAGGERPPALSGELGALLDISAQLLMVMCYRMLVMSGFSVDVCSGM